MTLPIRPPYAPMEARLVDAIPDGPGWQYEPKWDGFRCLAFRDGDAIALQSKSGQALARYFPELVAHLRTVRTSAFVLDGEIVVPVDGHLSFDDLLQRIHPAASRIERLSRERPAVLIVFDLLVDPAGRSLIARPLAERRRALDAFAARHLAGRDDIRLSPATEDAAQARAWLSMTGATLDGIVAKRLDLPYQSGERTGMQKVKRRRTVDCVVGGFRYAGRPRGGLPAPRSLRSRRAAPPRRLHVRVSHRHPQDPARRAPPADRAARLHRPRARRAQSLEPRALRGVGAAPAGAGRRGELRPLRGRSVPSRHALPALAAGQGAAAMHARPGER